MNSDALAVVSIERNIRACMKTIIRWFIACRGAEERIHHPGTPML